MTEILCAHDWFEHTKFQLDGLGVTLFKNCNWCKKTWTPEPDGKYMNEPQIVIGRIR